MPLSQEENNNLVDWLNEKTPAGESGCPICGHNDFVTERGGIFKREDSEVNTGQVFPVILMECRNCGHDLFFNEERIDI